MPQPLRLVTLAAVLAGASISSAAGLGRVRFVVVDPVTGTPIDGRVVIEDASDRRAMLLTSFRTPGMTRDFDTRTWQGLASGADAATIQIPAGQTVSLTQQGETPTKEIVIRVTASRLVAVKPSGATSATNRDRNEIQKFVNTTQADTRQLTKGQAGVAEDSAGQQHVRGEHSDVSYVVDGVPLPDTLSGRQGSIVVPATIQNLEIITGGYAPEFGGQTAAVLNITTLPRVRTRDTSFATQGGSYRTLNGDFTSLGPLGPRASYVFNLSSAQTDLGQEAPQPVDQTRHNASESQGGFAKLRLNPNSRDDYTITLSRNPGKLGVANRTTLPASFESVGRGYGLFGLRNPDGTRPDVTSENAGALGAAPIDLASQDAAGQDINIHEVSEFAVLNFIRKVSAKDTAQLSATVLHSGQEVTNGNPAVDVLNLPVDSSIEFNPTAARNVHHVQLQGSYSATRGAHRLKAGFLYDTQSGNESYRIEPASQLALNALAAIAPLLAPPGTAGEALDVNGNPVYTPSTGVTPTIRVRRQGNYRAAFVQDTWSLGRLTANMGLRADGYTQSQNLGQESVDAFVLSPRLNFQYALDRRTEIRWAYNHLFNTPPLAQGAIVGQAIQPETLDQYDVSVSHEVRPGQRATVAYYAKQITNQVDVGLLIPGSQIGLYSAVTLARGGVHGIEFSYDISAPKGYGWDAYFNYSYSSARPNGLDNTGEPVDDYNDHDQRHTVGVGIAYSWRSGATAALTYQYGSGLASSVVPPSSSRTPRDELDLRLTTGDKWFRGRGGLSLDVMNVFDKRDVINFQSAFSGTRFQQARRIFLTATFKL